MLRFCWFMFSFTFMMAPTCCAVCFAVFSSSPTPRKKITSLDPSDLLTRAAYTNMAAQLSSWPIRVYFPNPGRSSNYKFKMSLTSLSNFISISGEASTEPEITAVNRTDSRDEMNNLEIPAPYIRWQKVGDCTAREIEILYTVQRQQLFFFLLHTFWLSLTEDQILQIFLYGSEKLGFDDNQIMMRNVQ